jgi:multicomponent Na+:H+ antiporter subunit E
MNAVMLNVVFALTWMAVTGAFSVPNFVLGLVFGACALFIIRADIAFIGKQPRWGRIPALAWLFLKELLMSAIRVASIVVKRDMALKPGIFSYQSALSTPGQVTLLANLITLTPGTLTVDVAEDGCTLFIHAVDCSDVEATRTDIRDGFERRIREAFG